MKKVLALIVAVVLVATLSLSAVVMVSATSSVIVASEATAKAGDTGVAITVTLKDSPDITAAKVKIAYPSELTVESVELNTSLGGQIGTNKKPKDTAYPNPLLINWSNGGVDFSGDLLLGTIKFAVDSEAAEGDYTLEVSHNAADMADTSETEVAFGDQNGKITVVSCFHEHTKDVAAVASTCKTAGHAAYTECTDCGAVLSGSKDALPLDSANHEGPFETRDAVEATCGASGYTGDTYCTACGQIKESGKTIDATGAHNFVWINDNKEAHWQQCTVCKQLPEGTESEAHKFEYKVVKEATLEAEGLEEEVCSVCGYKSGETKAIPKLEDYTDTKEAEYDATGTAGSEISTKIPKSKLTAGLNVKITVDGKAIELTEGTDYDVTEDAQGNAKVTLKPAYLAKLANGSYKVEIAGAGGVSTSTVTVKNSAVGTTPAAAATGTATTETPKSPKDGDSNVVLAIVTFLALMSVCACVVTYRKKRSSK